MQQWEYTIVDSHPDPVVVKRDMDILGNLGWECFFIVNGPGAIRLYFKRPKES